MTRIGQRVAIVGGGASGVVAALNLSRALGRDGSVVLIERAGEPGRGLAYATRDPGHLLNVRVSNMSAFPNDPDHLFRWLQQHGPAYGVGCPTHFCFIPRAVYGAYLAGLFADALVENVARVTDEVLSVTETVGGVALATAGGRVIEADAAVLATGHDPRPPAPSPQVVDAWAPGALAGLEPEAAVLIKGTGLTMVDAVLSLARAGHRGRIVAVSRRGLLPHVHAAPAARPIARAEVPFGAPVSALLAWLRRLAARAEASGADWRSAVDSLRPHTRALWTAMSADEKRRFLRHARPWWDTHRHRMAPGVADTLGNLIADGRLTVLCAKVVEVAEEAGGLRVALRRRGAEECETLGVARVIDATGLPGDPAASPNPVIRHLLATGRARVDPLAIGLEIAENFAVVDAAGRASDRLFALGPPARGAFWETIAIPDIRLHAAEIADTLADRLRRRTRRAG